jgi:hypothetical protein
MPTLTYDFDARETLLTAQDVVDNAPVDPNSYADQRSQFITIREEKLFRAKFGMDFYKALLADKVKYSAVSGSGLTVYTNFQEGTTYGASAVVLYKNRLYKAKASGTTQIPTNEGRWTIAPKFETADNEYLWRRYLCTVLAFSVSSDSLFYRMVSDTPMGLVQKYDEGKTRPIKVQEAGRLKQEYQADIDDLIATMDAFLLENAEIFPDYLPTKEGCKSKNKYAKSKGRNFGFNTY